MDTHFSFRVFGPRALFADPMTKMGGEKSTYGVPTAEALRGIAESIYWKPTIEIVIDKVRIMNPIRKVSSGQNIMKYTSGKSNDQSMYQYLKDVCYEVEAHFTFNVRRPDLKHDYDTRKHHAIMLRSIEKGGRYPVFLGCNECVAMVEPCEFGKEPGYYDGFDMDLDRMFLSFTYPDFKAGPSAARFAQLKMENGIIDFSKAKNIATIPIRVIKQRAYTDPIRAVEQEYEEMMA